MLQIFTNPGTITSLHILGELVVGAHLDTLQRAGADDTYEAARPRNGQQGLVCYRLYCPRTRVEVLICLGHVKELDFFFTAHTPF